MESSIASGVRKYHGGCHCGAVRYEVEMDLSKGGSRCNCTICSRHNNWMAGTRPTPWPVGP
jgi:hypothetical protein